MFSTEFENLQTLWKTILLGANRSIEEPVTKEAVHRLSKKAESYIRTIESNQPYLWRDLSPIQLSVNFRSCYRRLRTLALAHAVKGTSTYEDANALMTILRSLDLLSSEAFNSSTKVNYNENVALSLKYAIPEDNANLPQWWNYKIGAPGPLVDIGMLLYSDLGPDRRQEYGKTIIKMIGSLDNPTLIGSNRANMCQLVLGMYEQALVKYSLIARRS